MQFGLRQAAAFVSSPIRLLFLVLGGFLSVKLCNKFNCVFRCLKRFVYFSHSITVSELLQSADIDMFIKCVTQSIPCIICYYRVVLVITCIPGATPLTYQLI